MVKGTVAKNVKIIIVLINKTFKANVLGKYNETRCVDVPFSYGSCRRFESFSELHKMDGSLATNGRVRAPLSAFSCFNYKLIELFTLLINVKKGAGGLYNIIFLSAPCHSPLECL